ncbi:MAG: 3D domain-containing protein [Candidatus Magasanikbacteria bacterium]|nr:3D domain-containing protein [Candidatus Magasanikbacteria bacterium]
MKQKKNHRILQGSIFNVVMSLVVGFSLFPRSVFATGLGSFMSTFSGFFVENSAAAVVSKSTFPQMADVEPVYEMWVLATAYSSDVWQTDSTPCKPAMQNFDLCEHFKLYGVADTIAANFLPLGKRVEFIDAGKFGLADSQYVVRDRMNGKYNGTVRIDVWMPTYEEAKLFGARWIKMKVYPYK